MKYHISICGVLLACAFVAAPQHVDAQFPKKLKDAAKKAAATKVQVPAQPAEPDPPPAPEAAGAPQAPVAPAPPSTPAEPTVWENYDFVPGNRVILYTDFSDDKVGNFATRLKYKSGAMDVVERGGVRMLRATSRSEFLIPVDRVLPDRFTLEFDVIVPATNVQGYDLLAFEGGTTMDRSDTSAELNWNPSDGAVLIGGGQDFSSAVRFPEPMIPQLLGQVAHLRLLMDGAYFKFYVNERRVYNIPELAFKREPFIRVSLRGSEEPGMAVYLTKVRLAESETDVLYDALADRGRWATQGILFGTGKAELQPESRPVLKEIASTMQQHGDLKILVEGHTDNVGGAASNLALSEARAAAVKEALVTQFGIEGGRITTQGFGDTKPVQPNSTPEGRAQNRRVEIAKV